MIEVVDHMGSDLSVVNAARVSFGKVSYELCPQDEKLIAYLAKHDHWSPFAHTSISLRCEEPIYLIRQLAKHQVGLAWNEVSRRYVSADVRYRAAAEIRLKPINAKQGSGAVHPQSDYWRMTFDRAAQAAIKLYEEAIAADICPEQARMVLPLSMLSTWVWTGSLYAFTRVYKQRSHTTAQEEAKVFAQDLRTAIEPLYPVSWSFLTKDSPNG